jgi:hypothetical protein
MQVLNFNYAVYLPHYVADNHACPTGVTHPDAMAYILDRIGEIVGGYNIITTSSTGCWWKDEEYKITETNTIVEFVTSRDVFEAKVMPELRKFKYSMNQEFLWVQSYPVEVTYV